MSKERMSLLYSLKTRLLENFYQKQNESRYKELSKIAGHNAVKLRAATATFMFDGVWYANYWPFTPNPRDMKHANRTLHDDFYDPVYQLVHHKDFESREDHAQVSNLVGNVLTESGHVQDIMQLLPGDFMGSSCFSATEQSVFNIAYPLDADEISRIKEQNVQGYHCLGRLKIFNLLLPDS